MKDIFALVGLVTCAVLALRGLFDFIAEWWGFDL